MTMAAVSEELSAQAAVSRRIQPTFGYYRQPNGWITISPITRLERLKYTEEGWTHLAAYGAFDMMVYTANHPFEGLFMFGGAKEMPVDQIIATGLYFEPPLVPRCRQHLTQFHRAHTRECWAGATKVEFPQLANVPAAMLGPFPCEFCARKLPTRQARSQHQSVAHSKEQGNLQTGKSLGESLAEALHGVRAPAATPSNAALQARIDELEAKEAKLTQRRASLAKARAARGKKQGALTATQ